MQQPWNIKTLPDTATFQDASQNQQRFAVLRLAILPEKAWSARGEGASTTNATVHANKLPLHLMASTGIAQGMKLTFTLRCQKRVIALFLTTFTVDLFQLEQDFFGDFTQLCRSYLFQVQSSFCELVKRPLRYVDSNLLISKILHKDTTISLTNWENTTRLSQTTRAPHISLSLKNSCSTTRPLLPPESSPSWTLSIVMGSGPSPTSPASISLPSAPSAMGCGNTSSLGKTGESTKGFPFHSGVCGLRVCSLEVAFTVATVRNRSQPQPWVSVELTQQLDRGQPGVRLNATYQYEAYASFHVIQLHTEGSPILLFSDPMAIPKFSPWDLCAAGNLGSMESNVMAGRALFGCLQLPDGQRRCAIFLVQRRSRRVVV